ncbi:MAG: hypothetical protein DRH08_04215 [Deltaproteobacteria bacterium]|nr:MAG: hypothetical protein DRH08_04215 [Deltaproteobacteria bacterium]
MKKYTRKIVYWGSGLSVYALMVAAVFSLLLESDTSHSLPVIEAPVVVSHGPESVQSLLDIVGQANGFSGILLPLGPEDGRLPGASAVWEEFLRADKAETAGMHNDGFDGLQVVENIAGLSNGSVAELFLAGVPQEAFHRGDSLFVLNSQGTVQIIDCADSRGPKISGLLPYQSIKAMEMQGDISYLLLSQPEAANDHKLASVDLGNPYKPREIARLSLPKQALFFYLSDRQLVVYTGTEGSKVAYFIHLYDLTDEFQLVTLGKTESPLLKSGFLKYGDYLVTGDPHSGLHVCDFSDPLQPVVVASIEIPDQISRLARYGDRLFALGGQNRMYVVSLRDPLHPVLLTVVEEANHAAYFMVHGHYSYYFTMNRYLRVFDIWPFDAMAESERWPGGIPGELVPLQGGAGFTLLGRFQGSLPAAVKDIFILPDNVKVVDTLLWQGFLAILGDDGLIQFFRQGKDSPPVFQESLKLPTAQRWLTATNDRLYVGGGSRVHIIEHSDDGHFVLSGQLELSGKESWDGLVVQQTLCLAAGKDGLLHFSLTDPDHPKIHPDWAIPMHLESQINVRQLVTPGGNEVLVAAGSVGLLSGLINNDGQFQFTGVFHLQAPVSALAVVNGFCLAATGTGISVIDIRTNGSLQNLGEISLLGVERFAVANPDFWAGYVTGVGWSALPSPHLVLPGDSGLSQTIASTTLSDPLAHRYRLNLFNDHEVINVPGVQFFFAQPGGQMTGTAYDAQ